MIQRITIEQLMALRTADHPPDRSATPPVILDVRTPAEYTHGHIPFAYKLPLFTNEERVLVGTTYKQKSKEDAILLGFELAGPKWANFIREALLIAPQKKVALHCWRGGMRSSAMAWALDLYGFEVYLLEGGYKRYRNWVLRQFEKTCQLHVIGGKTGSGKTKILHQLQHSGEQIIDLEDLAQHRGSSYGTMNGLVQPSQEQFENDFADQLSRLDRDKRIWVEDESSNIGHRMIPRPFWFQMRNGLLFDLQVALEQRVTALVGEYGLLDKAFLIECTERIRKRLGNEQTKNAITAICEDRMADFIRQVLVYYDKTYRAGLNGRDPTSMFSLPVNDTDPAANARQLINFAQTTTV